MMNIHALHGFLGRPNDWEILFKGTKHSDYLKSHDLFTAEPQPFNTWAAQLNTTILEEDEDRPRVLLGYSLGSRLAMYLLSQNPTMWDGAILVSPNPGLQSDQEREERLMIDAKWADKFEMADWQELMLEWNAREVFKNDTISLKREESEYSRKILSSVLKVWSLSKQRDFREFLNNLQIPVLWITGSEDSAYEKYTSQIALQHPHSKKISFPSAGHRVPWQQPKRFMCEIETFLDQLKDK